jgi:glutamine synthetase
LDAINLFDRSSFYRNALGDSFVDYLTTLKRAEWHRYHQAISEWEQNEYFGLF